VYVWWTQVRLVKSSYTNKAYRVFRSAIIAPKSSFTRRATANFLSYATITGHINIFRATLDHLYLISFDKCIDCKRRTGFPLTPGAMTAVHEHRNCCQFIFDLSASAPTLNSLVLIHLECLPFVASGSLTPPKPARTAARPGEERHCLIFAHAHCPAAT